MSDEELKALAMKGLAGDRDAMDLFMTVTEERANYLKYILGINTQPQQQETL